MPQAIFSNFNEDIRPRLPHTPRIRVPLDTIQDQRIFVYEYLRDDFLAIVRNQISLQARKEILNATFEGIAELHDCDIVHLGKSDDDADWWYIQFTISRY